MALKAPYIDQDAALDLDESVFGEPFHTGLVHETVRADRAARRQGTASTKTRGEVAMSGGKAWRQKGTGRARAGPLSTPQRVGGGVAFGPKPRRYAIKVNRKARRKALRSALSLHAQRGSLGVVDPQSFRTPATKQAAAALETLGSGSALVVVSDGEEPCARSFRNLARVGTRAVDDLAVADVMACSRIVLSTSAVHRVTELAQAPAHSGGSSK